MELQIPLRVAEAILFAGVLLDLHQLHDILFGHLGGSEFGDVAFDQLARLQQLKRPAVANSMLSPGTTRCFCWLDTTWIPDPLRTST